MKRVIKLTERDLSRIVRRVVKEDEESKKELDMETKLDDIFFGNDSLNIFTPAGEFGYLSQEKRELNLREESALRTPTATIPRPRLNPRRWQSITRYSIDIARKWANPMQNLRIVCESLTPRSKLS